MNPWMRFLLYWVYIQMRLVYFINFHKIEMKGVKTRTIWQQLAIEWMKNTNFAIDARAHTDVNNINKTDFDKRNLDALSKSRLCYSLETIFLWYAHSTLERSLSRKSLTLHHTKKRSVRQRAAIKSRSNHLQQSGISVQKKSGQPPGLTQFLF